MTILGGILGDLLDPVKDIVSEVVVDKDKKLEIQFKLKELEDKINERFHDEVMGQLDINKTEASSGSVFVAGWRPFIGWASGAGFIYSAIIQPFLNWSAVVWFDYSGPIPALNDTVLLTVMGGMLGIGGLRTWEKIKGVSTNDYTDTPGRTQTSSGPTTVEVTPEGAVSVETAPSNTSTQSPKRKKVFGVF